MVIALSLFNKYILIMPLNYLLFTQIILFLFITPGSPRILIMSYAMKYGMKKSIWTAVGDISANSLQMLIVIFGIGTLLFTYPDIFLIIKWIGILYLIYLAFDILKSKTQEIASGILDFKKSNFSFFKDGFIVAGMSPKAWIFIGPIFPTFINFDKNYILQFFILGLSYIILDFISLIIYGLIARKIIVWLKANPKTINLISSIALLSIALIASFIKI